MHRCSTYKAVRTEIDVDVGFASNSITNRQIYLNAFRYSNGSCITENETMNLVWSINECTRFHLSRVISNMLKWVIILIVRQLWCIECACRHSVCVCCVRFAFQFIALFSFISTAKRFFFTAFSLLALLFVFIHAGCCGVFYAQISRLVDY